MPVQPQPGVSTYALTVATTKTKPTFVSTQTLNTWPDLSKRPVQAKLNNKNLVQVKLNNKVRVKKVNILAGPKIQV